MRKNNILFFFSSRRRHTRFKCDWSSDVCSSDLLKESGLHQIAQQLGDPAKLPRFLNIVSKADGCVASTPETAELYQQARPKSDPATVAFIATPYPLQDRQWNFTVPPNRQSGILVGTR